MRKSISFSPALNYGHYNAYLFFESLIKQYHVIVTKNLFLMFIIQGFVYIQRILLYLSPDDKLGI